MTSLSDLRRCKYWTEIVIGSLYFTVGYSRNDDELDIHVIYINGYDQETNFLEILADFIIDKIETKIKEER